MAQSGVITAPPAGRRRRRFRKLDQSERRNIIHGLLFVSPWIIGFVAFTAYPIFDSFRLSFTEYSGFGSPEFIGVDNYSRMMDDTLFWKSLYNTLYYTILAVPVGVVVALILAIAMNQKMREIPIYRAMFFLPSILPVFAVSLIFLWLLNPRYGLTNLVMVKLGLPSVNWLGDAHLARIAIVLLAQLGAGQVALFFLAGLKAIPSTLYDAASIDGANAWQKFSHVTLPLLTPVILYDIILGLTLGLQVFTQAYIMTQGGPNNATLFYVLYLYRQAFRYGDMGYAAALSWVLFLISLVLAIAVFKASKRWVHYELTA